MLQEIQFSALIHKEDHIIQPNYLYTKDQIDLLCTYF